MRATSETGQIPFAAKRRSYNGNCHVTPCPPSLQGRGMRATNPAISCRFIPASKPARHHCAFSFDGAGLLVLNISSIRSVTT